jgi:predicted Zn-dependent peptidase
MEIRSLTLPNGIRIVHSRTSSKVAHCGLFIHAGTRNERNGEHGIAHFIEHTIFKGTEKRNLFQVLNRLENVGADLNAFTTKEDTCIHASFLTPYYERVIELFHDLCFHSIFPEKEIGKEKQVVIDEIRSYEDTPSDQVYDDFEDLVFAGHPLGRNILGTVRSVKSISRDKILGFRDRTYRTNRILIATLGDIPLERFEELARKYFEPVVASTGGNTVKAPLHYAPTTKFVRKKTGQVHCMIGSPSYPFSHKDRVPMALLNNILGGPTLNSRLSLALRERNGLTYHADSSYTPYHDTGIFAIYFGTDPALFDKATGIVHRELKHLREKKLGTLQLSTVKKQLKGQVAISYESHLAVMLGMGKSFLVQNRYDTIGEIFRKIDEVTAEKLIGIANEVFDPGMLSMLAFLPD